MKFILFFIFLLMAIASPFSIQTKSSTQVHNFCVICEQSSKFLSYGVKPRPHAECPKCRSLERTRALFLLLKMNNVLDNTLTMLHFSPNTALQKILKSRKNITYLGSNLGGGPGLIDIDIRNINLPSNSMDIIICFHVLEHVVEDDLAIKELVRVLKPGGIAFVQVPHHQNPDFKTFEDISIVTPADRLKYFGQWDHVRIYGKKDFEKRLTKGGFQFSKSDDIFASFDKATRDKYSVHTTTIYLCKKS